ncbi:MAG: hypothetical protein IPJ77_01855 [Planctomycetes bacterium]|nr:hypothetical protein [Planctomycetota bacterium]
MLVRTSILLLGCLVVPGAALARPTGLEPRGSTRSESAAVVCSPLRVEVSSAATETPSPAALLRPGFGPSARTDAPDARSAPTARDDAPTLTDVRAQEKVALVRRLHELARWCNDQKLYQERDRVWRQVIALEPDDLDARKGLRFARNPDGTWKEPAPRPAQNLNKKALAELPARRAAALAPYRDALLAALDREPAATRPTASVHQDLLALDPDDAVVRTRRGEVRDGDAWVLAETVRGRARRTELRALVQAALAAPVELAPSPAAGPELPWVDAWTYGARSERVRVLSTGDAADGAALAGKLDATVRVVAELFGVPAKGPAEFTFYVAPGAAREAFLARHPAFDDALRAAFAKTPGAGLPGSTHTVLFEAEARRRDDCAVRNALWQLLRLHFGVERVHGWAFEGLGLYLTRELVGSRLTWSVLANRDAEALRAGLLAPESNWMNEGLTLMRAPNAPPLATVLDLPVTAMTVPDLVVGYVFSAYLLEGRPGDAANFLARTGAGKKADETAREVLGTTMDELKPRLVRWLEERR